jgi:hypothetical protein
MAFNRIEYGIGIKTLKQVGIEISAVPAAISSPKLFRIDIHAGKFRMGKTREKMNPDPVFLPLLSGRMEQTGIRIGALIRAEK